MNEKSRILSLVKDKSKRCAVIGLGVSNMPLIDFLLSFGARITAYDKKEKYELGESARMLEEKGVALVCGERYLDSVEEDVIFRSPGIRPDLPALKSAKERGAVITSEMEFFFELCPTKIYAVTGSDGKTTTTTLTHLFLSEAMKRNGNTAYLGGNIGAPLLPKVREMKSEDVSVLELSSFQLMGGNCVPDFAAITNITPNHLNWHKDMDEYISAKRSVCGKKSKKVVLNADNGITSSFNFGESIFHVFFSSTRSCIEEIIPVGVKRAAAVFLRDGKIVYQDGERGVAEEILDVSDIKLPGKHNIENYMTAIALTYGDVDPCIYRDIAHSFGGVEHRLEFVAEINGVKYYNSSIDSSPTRTAAALSALAQKPIVICGGSDKNIPFEPLAITLCERAKTVVLNGEASKKIHAALDECPLSEKSGLTVYETETLAEAISLASEKAEKGDTVLLSPACASFDQFKNFAERGDFFKKMVFSMKDEN